MKHFLSVSVSVVLIVGNIAWAEPTSPPVKVIDLRPYIELPPDNVGAVFISVDQITLCETDVYKIPVDRQGGKEAYAAALAALVSDKSVRIELDNDEGCTTGTVPGWGSTVQSIYIEK